MISTYDIIVSENKQNTCFVTSNKSKSNFDKLELNSVTTSQQIAELKSKQVLTVSNNKRVELHSTAKEIPVRLWSSSIPDLFSQVRTVFEAYRIVDYFHSVYSANNNIVE